MANLAQNQDIAQRLREVAQILEVQGANQFRVRAYRTAAETIERLPDSVAQLAQEQGTDGLQALPGIGVSLARSIHTLVVTGRLPMLDRLRGHMDPIALLSSIPGIGSSLAQRIHDDLGLDTLEQLEMAAHDGRLTEVEGIGPKKLQGIIDSLTARLGRIRQRTGKTSGHPTAEPPVEELLDVDREYREQAQAGSLQRIAPHRFNPTRDAWLPILHTQRGLRHYSAMFSNTALAHRLKKTQDWVILYCDDADGERQYTVVTGHTPPLAGKRLVRGREKDCEAHYHLHEAMTTAGTSSGS